MDSPFTRSSRRKQIPSPVEVSMSSFPKKKNRGDEIDEQVDVVSDGNDIERARAPTSASSLVDLSTSDGEEEEDLIGDGEREISESVRREKARKKMATSSTTTKSVSSSSSPPPLALAAAAAVATLAAAALAVRLFRRRRGSGDYSSEGGGGRRQGGRFGRRRKNVDEERQEQQPLKPEDALRLFVDSTGFVAAAAAGEEGEGSAASARPPRPLQNVKFVYSPFLRAPEYNDDRSSAASWLERLRSDNTSTTRSSLDLARSPAAAPAPSVLALVAAGATALGFATDDELSSSGLLLASSSSSSSHSSRREEREEKKRSRGDASSAPSVLATGSLDDEEEEEEKAERGSSSSSSSSTEDDESDDERKELYEGAPNVAFPRAARLGGSGARASACIASGAADVALGLDGLVGLGACSAAQGLLSLRATAGAGLTTTTSSVPPPQRPPVGAGPLASLCVSARSFATLAATARALSLPGCSSPPLSGIVADEARNGSRPSSSSSSLLFKSTSSSTSSDPVQIIVAEDLFEGCFGGGGDGGGEDDAELSKSALRAAAVGGASRWASGASGSGDLCAYLRAAVPAAVEFLSRQEAEAGAVLRGMRRGAEALTGAALLEAHGRGLLSQADAAAEERRRRKERENRRRRIGRGAGDEDDEEEGASSNVSVSSRISSNGNDNSGKRTPPRGAAAAVGDGDRSLVDASAVRSQVTAAMSGVLGEAQGNAVLLAPVLPGPLPLSSKTTASRKKRKKNAAEKKRFEQGVAGLGSLAALSGLPRLVLPLPVAEAAEKLFPTTEQGKDSSASFRLLLGPPPCVALVGGKNSDGTLIKVAAQMAPVLAEEWVKAVAAGRAKERASAATAETTREKAASTPTTKATNEKTPASSLVATALREEGNAAFRSGDFAAAVAHYTAAARADPTCALALSNRAAAHLKLLDFESAERDATSALRLDARQPKALLRRGIARIGMVSGGSGGVRGGVVNEQEECRLLESARGDLQAVLALEPGNRQARAELELLMSSMSGGGGASSAASRSSPTPETKEEDYFV